MRDRRPPALRLLAGVATLALALGPGLPGARGDAGGARRGAAPLDNASHVHDDDPALLQTLENAAQAEAAGRFAAAAEQLQSIVDQRFVDATGRECAPHVLAVNDGRATYEGAWIVARHRLASSGPELREAYAARYSVPARQLLAAATRALDETRLGEVARRFLPLAEGRAAALLLVDLALERGDVDAAFARLEALEDLEEVSATDAATLAAWRAERLAREARLLARTPADVPAVLARLDEAARAGPAASLLDERVPPGLRRKRAALPTWPTTGGAHDRAGVAPALGGALVPQASLALVEDAEQRAMMRDDLGAQADRPSPWVAPRAAVGRDVVFTFDGEVLQAVGRADGVVRHRVRLRGDGEARADAGVDPRAELPLLEGHTLTLDEHPGRATRVLVASTERARPLARISGEAEVPRGEIVMVRWDGERLLRGWRTGSFVPGRGLPEGLSLFGAPCLHMGLAWVAGVRASQATTDQLECWLVGLDPGTGEALRQVRLGSGSPLRLKRLDEAIPSSPAAAHGRVVVSTSLGWVAAVDAEDGRIAWVHRYDRGLETGRMHRLGTQEAEMSPRLTGFANEPPLIAFGLTVVAPTDSHQLLGLATRPRGLRRDLVRWDPLDRRERFERMAVEAIVGAVGGDGSLPATIVVSGKGDAAEGEPPGHILAGLEPRDGLTRWSVVAATGRQPATFGRAALTEDRAYVPTLHGLVVVDLRTGRVLDLLGHAALPPGEAYPESRWYGTLVPLPGEGLVALNEGYLTFWRLAK